MESYWLSELAHRLSEAAGIVSPEQVRFQAAYRDDPVAFVHDCLRFDEGRSPTPYQEEMLTSVVENHRASVRSPHGVGKSAVAAWLVLWFALTRDGASDWKVVTTAGAWAQLTHYLWPEVHKWADRVRWGVVGREPLDPRRELLVRQLKLRTGAASSVASTNSQFIEGAHADSLLYVFDEAKSIQEETFDAAEGAFAAPETSETFAFAPSVPAAPEGRFYDIHRRAPGLERWWARHVTLAEAAAAGMISQGWVDDCRALWGEDHFLFQNRCLGEFAAGEERGLVPVAWIEAANLRWKDWDAAGRPGRVTSIAADVASGVAGRDKSVIAVIYDHVIVGELEIYDVLDAETATMQLCGIAAAKARKHKCPVYPDVVGIGAGLAHRLAEQGVEVRPFNGGARTRLLDRSGELGFANWRTAAYWLTREMLDPDQGVGVALPDSPGLTGDLTSIHVLPKETSGGRYALEHKDSFRRRKHRSTDEGDAVTMGLVGPFLWREKFEREHSRVGVWDPTRARRR